MSRLQRKEALYALARPYERKDAGDPDFAEIKKSIEGMMTAFDEFKKTNDERIKQVEKKGVADPVTEQKLVAIEKKLQESEAINQKLTAAEAAQKQAKEEAEAQKKRIDELELKLKRPKAGGAIDPEERKAKVNAWARAVVAAQTVGIANLSADQQKALAEVATEFKALSILPDTAGGYLAPSEFVLEIIKAATETSPFRPLVRLRQTANKSIMIPKRTGQFAARRVTEQGTRSETTGLSYGSEEMALPEMYALIDISNQMLEDSAFDMEAEIRMEADEQFAVKEGAEFVSGTGVGEFQGILSHPDLASTVSGSAATIADANGQADGILTLKHAIKTAYARNATFLLNRTTLGSVRKLKDTNKQYIWMPGLAQGKPNTIDGDPYVEIPDMPSEGANLYPIAYGDWRRAYVLADRIAMELLRDPYTQATSGNVRFIFRRRVGAKVVLAEAYRALKCST